MKTCTRCHTEKKLDDFPVGRGRQGRGSWCKKCHSDYLKENKDHVKARVAKYRKLHGAVSDRTPNRRFKQLRDNATRLAKLGIVSNLTFEQWAEIVSSGVCLYCNQPLPEVGSGVDRKNSSLGYVIGNCVPCCTTCNHIRGKDLISHEEMIEVAKLLRNLRTLPTAGVLGGAYELATK